jgi:membrane-bound lytic murein transglycosylase D
VVEAPAAPLPAIEPAPAPSPVAEAASAPAAPAAPVVAAPRIRLDPLSDAERADLWQRVRDGYALPAFEGELVHRWEQWYSSRPDYVTRMTERGARYLFHIVEEIDRRGMPMELALLPFIESAFNPQAMSVARASGMWQFMPGTGKEFELRQNIFRDDRRDVLASTRAALDYLQQLHTRFGDWHLALAAYNWGQGNVQRAIRNNLRAGRPAGYADLRMPDETRNYVPKLQAVVNIIARPGDFALSLPPLENHPFFISLPIEHDIDVALVARLSGLSPEEFQQLNPQLNKPVILAAGTPQVLLPYDNANRFVRGLNAHKGALATWTAWVAPRTLKPADAAKMVGMSEDRLREVNRIPARMLVKVGSTLLVPRSANATANVPEHVADNAMMAFAPEGRPMRRINVKIGRKGETVASIARRHRVSAEQVAVLNGVSAKGRFKAGQVVKINVPTRTASKATTRKAAARPAARTRSTAQQTAPRQVKRTAGARKPVTSSAPVARKPAAR